MANGYVFASSSFTPAAFSGIGKVTVMSQPELKRTLDLIEPASAQAPPYFDHALQDAERLLNYAAESGIDVDSETRNDVLHARSQCTRGVSDQTTANLLTALTKLAARIKPVTAESLRACANQERRTAHFYVKVAIALALIIIPCSVCSFVTSAIADAIRK